MDRGYQLIRKIAGGGMGEVFVARLTGADNFEKRVALKLLLPHLASSPELLHRFHAEARLAARMHHPNIVEIFDVGEADGRPFIAMQLVDGVTLSQLLRELEVKGEQLPLPLARLIATGLCEALSYAHALTDGHDRPLNVVHRDVTPSNVLVSRNGAVLLTDFGIARVADGSINNPSILRGKVAYLAPEQFLYDAPVDARVDIYAAGLTLYEALTGVHPHKRESMSEALNAVKEGRVAPIDTLRSDVTAGIAKGIHQALARRPQDRLSTARQLREAFSDGPVATAPELAEFVRRTCGESQPFENDDEGPGTHSFLSLTLTQLDLPISAPALPKTPRGRGRLLWGGLLALGTLAALWSWRTASNQTPHSSPMLSAAPDSGTHSEPSSFAVVSSPSVEPQEDAGAQDPVELGIEFEPFPEPKTTSVRPARGIKRAKKPVAAVAPPLTPSLGPVRLGYLTADASPWAEVLLGGRVIDRTPFVRHPLPAGRYTLVFRAPGGATKERDIAVMEGEITAIRVEF